MKKQKNITIRTGTAEDFLNKVKATMRAADRGEVLKPSRTLIFADPQELLHFLSAAKIKLINIIRNHPDTITNIAKATKRNRSAVYRDIQEMEDFGIVTTHEEINPGHGRHKVVELVAAKLKLEAYI